jgi:hypothetical protein
VSAGQNDSIFAVLIAEKASNLRKVFGQQSGADILCAILDEIAACLDPPKELVTPCTSSWPPTATDVLPEISGKCAD